MLKKIGTSVFLLLSVIGQLAAATDHAKPRRVHAIGHKAARRIVRHLPRKGSHAAMAASWTGASGSATASGSAMASGASASMTHMAQVTETRAAIGEDLHLTGLFEKHRGQLPWPLSGTVSMAFGPHAYMKNIWHNNVGVTIDAPEGTPVHAVYDGVVSDVEDFDGAQYVVLRHGNYLTCYSNLGSTDISIGQHVRTGERLGCIGSVGQLEFMLSNKKNQYFDPEKWLRR